LINETIDAEEMEIVLQCYNNTEKKQANDDDWQETYNQVETDDNKAREIIG
jgi:hypothetical protein